MHRRAFITSSIGGVALVLAPIVVEAQSTPEAPHVQVRSEWTTSSESDGGLEAFITVITAHESENQAEDAFNGLLKSVQQGTLDNEDTQNETFGDESFFVEYNNLGGLFLLYEGTIRIGELIYQFRWEAVHYGGARDGHRLFETVIERAVVKGSYTEEELTALLPTEDEVAEYGLAAQEEG